MTATKKTKKNSRATLSHALSPADMPNPWCFRAETALQVGAWKAKYFFNPLPAFRALCPRPICQLLQSIATDPKRPVFAHRFSAFVFISGSGEKEEEETAGSRGGRRERGGKRRRRKRKSVREGLMDLPACSLKVVQWPFRQSWKRAGCRLSYDSRMICAQAPRALFPGDPQLPPQTRLAHSCDRV